MKKRLLWSILYGTVLTGFTTYVLLDTFVLSRSYQTDATQMNTSMFSDVTETSSTESSATETTTTASVEESSETESYAENSEQNSGHRSHHRRDAEYNTAESEDSAADTESSSSSDSSQASSLSSYQDDDVQITLTEYTEYDTKIYVADITLSSAESLKTAFAQDTYGRNVVETTSEIASSHDAILAINGDYYGAQESGYVIRNGIVYRSTASDADVLCIYADGTMQVVDASEKSAEELVEEGVWQAFSFGPALVENSAIAVTENEEVGKAMASNPRTAIGILGQNHFVFVVADGRTSESAGLSLYEMASFLQELGVTTAYNLDGGGSSTMVFQGTVINNPTTNGDSIKEREVSDIVYIG